MRNLLYPLLFLALNSNGQPFDKTMASIEILSNGETGSTLIRVQDDGIIETKEGTATVINPKYREQLERFVTDLFVIKKIQRF